MRYRDLLAVLVIVAVGAWLLARPSPPVTVPNAASRPLSSDRSMVPNPFTVQDLGESVCAPEAFLADWRGLSPRDFYLSFAIKPADTLRDTVFTLDYQGPEGFLLRGVILEDLAGQWMFYPGVRLNSNRGQLVFRGDDIGTDGWDRLGDHLAKTSRIPERLPAGLWRVSAYLDDPRNGDFYRTPQTLRLVSPPAEMP